MRLKLVDLRFPSFYTLNSVRKLERQQIRADGWGYEVTAVYLSEWKPVTKETSIHDLKELLVAIHTFNAALRWAGPTAWLLICLWWKYGSGKYSVTICKWSGMSDEFNALDWVV